MPLNPNPSSPAIAAAAAKQSHLRSLLARAVISGDVLTCPSSLVPVLSSLSVSPSHSSTLLFLRPLALHVLPLLPLSSPTTLYLFNLLLRSFSRSPIPLESLFLFSSMLRLTLLPNRFTFPSLFIASSSLSSPLPGVQTQSQALRRGFLSDCYVINTLLAMYTAFGDMCSARSIFHLSSVVIDVVSWNTMINGYVKVGELDAARKLFDEMPVKNEVSWSAIIGAYVENGELDVARLLFDEMPVRRNVVSWNCYVKTNQHLKALELFNTMQKQNEVEPNEITMVSVLSACANLAALDKGKWIHSYIDKTNMILDNKYNLGAALIDMYSKCGSVDLAFEVFNSLQNKNVSSWNALITGLAINGASYESLRVFEDMQRSGTKPNDITFVGLLSACTHGGLVDEGRRYFGSMSKVYGVHPEMKHYGCMVDLFGRAGLLEEAENMVRAMPMKPDAMIVGALLGACRIHKDVRVAERVRNEFLQLESKENSCHFLMSNIYASVGRWGEACNHLEGSWQVLLELQSVQQVPPELPLNQLETETEVSLFLGREIWLGPITIICLQHITRSNW
ncbi:Pentatricopeptide repeat-containing protein [Apostasia shenzhenica]|uniref:Pentatricopeptide repeat-containing protein n=1 Tax=Apostasia shenzhenica TaxID=1088818 RepID=A0A2I0A728_9ASPA|nr:Pentatricopeptide repeat-containing protein [Apostasia shenzhenica]